MPAGTRRLLGLHGCQHGAHVRVPLHHPHQVRLLSAVRRRLQQLQVHWVSWQLHNPRAGKKVVEPSTRRLNTALFASMRCAAAASARCVRVLTWIICEAAWVSAAAVRAASGRAPSPCAMVSETTRHAKALLANLKSDDTTASWPEAGQPHSTNIGTECAVICAPEARAHPIEAYGTKHTVRVTHQGEP